MDSTYTPDPRAVAIGILIARLVFGLLFAAHGSQKLFGWFRGYGLEGTGGFFDGLGFHPGRRFAAAAGTAELTGGLLIALGLLGPVGPGLVLSVMIVAVITVHWGNGLLATSNGSEVPILYSTVAIVCAIIGYGPYSIDAAAGLTNVWSPWITLVVLVLGLLGGLANVAMRRRPPAAQGA